MEALAGKLVGKLGPRTWAQVYDFTPEAEEKVAGRGRMVAVVSMETAEDEDQVGMVQAGREMLSRLHEQYFGDETGSAYEALKGAVMKVREEFERVEIAGVAMVGNVLYIVVSEGTGVYVSSQGKQGWLVRPGNTGKSQAAFSGKGNVNEVVVLGNGKFWQGVTEGMLKAAVATAQEEMEAGVEILAAVGRGNNMAGGEAGVMLKLTKVEEDNRVTVPETERYEEILSTPETGENNEPRDGNFRSRIITTIRNKLSGGFLNGKIYIRHGDKQSQRRKMMYAGVGFLALLLLMAGVGQVLIRQRKQQDSVNETLIEKLTDDFNEAKADATLNPPRSRQLLIQITSEIDQLKQQKVKDNRVDSIEKEYDRVLQEASGVVNLNMTELLDLNLVRTGINGVRLARDGGKLEVLDSSGGRVIEADIKTGAGNVVAGGDNLTGARIIATYPGKTFVLTDNGIMTVPGIKPVVDKDQEWGKITDMKVYTGNIYLLDSTDGQIWRLNVNTSGGFGGKQLWLSEKNGDPEIKQGTGMAIDGSIWVIKPGILMRFTRGVKDAITITGLENLWGGGAVLYTDENTQKLYVLDPANKRVIVLNKSGQYEKQYKADNLGAAKDLTVDETGGRMYFTGETKVWAASI